MAKYLLVAGAIFLYTLGALGQDGVPPDSLPRIADTMYVIPAGPVAGAFTPHCRLSVLDTVAGWAKIQVEGWVPVGAVADRLANGHSHQNPLLAPAPATPSPLRTQCAAITKKGTRCKRLAQPGSQYCWQHDPNRAK
ncbi:hypothetical protein KKH27_00055 [bacterium]|nr:hypothetical protein [bacterium]MBU1984156.1 hypothetical protein [bacterium]